MQARDYLKAIPINYLPNQVDIADLKSNGLLITDEEKQIMNDYHRVHLIEQGGAARKMSKKKSLFLRKNKINQSFILFEDGVYAQYKGKKYNKSLGKGAFGCVKLLQNINTGEWVAKKNLDMKKSKLRHVEQEAKMNQAVNGLGEYLIEPSADPNNPDPKKASLIMHLEPGITLKEAIETIRDDMSPQDLLRICESMFASLNEIHAKGLLHRDVKLENNNLLHLRAKLIDFGFTIDVSDPELSDYFLGTPLYKSPEIAKKYTRIPSYSIKSDSCAMAICMRKWFDLDGSYDANGVPIIVMKRGSKFKKLIPDENARQKIMQLILNLTAPDVSVRMDPVIGERMLRQIRNEMAFSKVDSKKIAVLDLNDFASMSKTEKETLLVALKQFDEVVLAANAVYKLDGFQISKLQRHFERHGIYCSGGYEYTDASRGSVLLNLQKIMDKNDSSTLFHIMQVSTAYCLLSTETNTNLAGFDIDKRLNLDKSFKPKDFVKAIDQLYSQAIVTASDVNKVRGLLEKELFRLKSKVQTPDTKKRTQFIDGFIKNLTSNASTINYTKLYGQLAMLEGQLKTVKRNKYVPLFFQTKSRSVKEVAHIKQVIAPSMV